MPWLVRDLVDGEPPGVFTKVPGDTSPAPGHRITDVDPHGKVWDAAAEVLRERTPDEVVQVEQAVASAELASAKARKVDEFAEASVRDLDALFTSGHGDRETLYALAKHIQAIFAALDLTITDPRLLGIIEVGDYAMGKRAEIEAAASLADLDAIQW